MPVGLLGLRALGALPGGKVDVLAGRDRGQRREPAQVGAADVKPAELDALDQGVPSLRPSDSTPRLSCKVVKGTSSYRSVRV